MQNDVAFRLKKEDLNVLNLTKTQPCIEKACLEEKYLTRQTPKKSCPVKECIFF